jgi:hypothetical protein
MIVRDTVATIDLESDSIVATLFETVIALRLDTVATVRYYAGVRSNREPPTLAWKTRVSGHSTEGARG